MTERLTLAALFNLAKLTRRVLARIARRSVDAELLLMAAGVDVDSFFLERQPKAVEQILVEN
jgi:hypothetical protein